GPQPSPVSRRRRTPPGRARKPAGGDEARFRALFEAATDAVFIETTDGRILDCNPTACEIYGYSREEFLRLNVRDLLPAEIVAQLSRVGKQISAQGRLHLETVNKKKDGSVFPCEVSLRLVRVGRTSVFVVFVRDITERHKAERIRNAAFRISEAAQSTESLNDLFLSIHAVISELMPARNFYIALFDPDRDLLTFPYFIDEFDEPVKPKRPGKGLTEYVLRTGAPLLASPEIFKRLLRRRQIESIGAPSIDWLGVPLKVQGRTIGVMVVQTYAAGVRYTEEDKAILLFVSTQAAMAIQRKRSEEALKSSLREKEVLLREIHHRVKNNLQVVSSLLSLQSRHLKEGEAMSFLKESQRRIRSMALVHEKLYQSKDLARIDMAGYIESLVQHLFQASRVAPSQVRFRSGIRDVALDINTAMPCGLLISELVSNALKHAFPGDRAGTIAVELRPEGEGTYVLIVRDDGAGFPEGLDYRRTDSLGMQLVLLLVEQLDGTIELAERTRAGGTEFRVRFQEPIYK
ncbi:MAG: PAS domain S-box protein, partial [Candidatus Aminicenantes bacterium]|nr:PAS domain S-box protein [Candidatus Aminicenantes bacterium]